MGKLINTSEKDYIFAIPAELPLDAEQAAIAARRAPREIVIGGVHLSGKDVRGKAKDPKRPNIVDVNVADMTHIQSRGSFKRAVELGHLQVGA